jgi:hypothetical protein
MPGERDENVAQHYSRLLRGALRLDLHDQQSGLPSNRPCQRLGQLDDLGADAEVALTDVSLLS